MDICTNYKANIVWMGITIDISHEAQPDEKFSILRYANSLRGGMAETQFSVCLIRQVFTWGLESGYLVPVPPRLLTIWHRSKPQTNITKLQYYLQADFLTETLCMMLQEEKYVNFLYWIVNTNKDVFVRLGWIVLVLFLFNSLLPRIDFSNLECHKTYFWVSWG